ncbi:MAG: hypothetical protein IPH53_17315 [Flavobacteriales bacterium]|nr:hypothetical protein [Flavobacteriales bacterium]
MKNDLQIVNTLLRLQTAHLEAPGLQQAWRIVNDGWGPWRWYTISYTVARTSKKWHPGTP